MKKSKSYIRPALGTLLLAALVLAGGCVKRELEIRPDEGRVEIALDWGGDTRPQTARFLFYDQAGTLVKEETGLTDGFKGMLPTGTYRVVVHNTDARQVDYRGTEKYESAEVFAQHTNYSDGHHPSEGIPCVLEPQLVFGTGRLNEGDEIVVKQLDTTCMTVTPVLLTKQVVFHFKVEGDATAVQSLTGVFEGVAPGIFLSNGTHNTSSSCALEFTAAPETKAAETDYIAGMSVFQLLTTATSPAGTNRLTATLTLSDGSKASGTFDLTETLKKIILDNGGAFPNPIPLAITLRVVPLGGLSATVTPWDDSGTGSGDPRPQP